MYQPDFPPVPFRSGLLPGGGQRTVDRTSVGWQAYVLSSYASKIGAMKRWKPMSWRQLRWAAAITRDCLSTIYWRLADQSIRRMASIWGRKILQATDLNAIRAAGPAAGRFDT